MDTEVSALKAAFSVSNDWFEYSTIVVLAGLVFELVVLFALHKTASWREKSVLIAGTFIIAIGVAGEWHFGSEATAAALRLQAIADEKVATLIKETAKANEVAAKANERTAELKLALEKEVAARQPRTISAQQHDQIVEYLKNTNPKGPITVVWKLFDEEAEKFGRQVIAALKDSGFDVTEGRGPFGFGERGAWIAVRDLEKVKAAPSAIGAVQGAFRDILHIQFDGGERKEGYPDVDVTIAIGAKP
jgi:hypothetical protein